MSLGNSQENLEKVSLNIKKYKERELKDCNIELDISKNVSSEIYSLHSTCGHTEWSGLIFYSMDKNPIVSSDINIKILHFHLFDIGTPGYTEFKIDARIVDVYDKYPELIDCKIGILHTHHAMKAFFSGTDQNTLHELAPQFDFLLSVIVNLDGDVRAKLCYLTEEEYTKNSIIKYTNNTISNNTESGVETILNIIDCKVFFETSLGKEIEELKKKAKEKKKFSLTPKLPIDDFSRNTNVFDSTQYEIPFSQSLTSSITKESVEDMFSKILIDSIGYKHINEAIKEFNFLVAEDRKEFVKDFEYIFEYVLEEMFELQLTRGLNISEIGIIKSVARDVISKINLVEKNKTLILSIIDEYFQFNV